MGSSGDQQYLGRVEILDEVLGKAYLNNVIVSCQINDGISTTGVTPAFTVYLSKSGSTGAGGGGWVDTDVITARSTAAGGGTVNLVARKVIKTNSFGSAVAEDIGPVHIWAECTDTAGVGQDNDARFTIEAWGYFHNLISDLS